MDLLWPLFSKEKVSVSNCNNYLVQASPYAGMSNPANW
jgi:V-type H+-transporting ATPase proteolipid subunit